MYLAIDWGTTNRRVYLIDDAGTVRDGFRDDRGVRSTPQAAYASELAGLRARFGDLPVICAGMIGSDQGWVKTAYVACPAGIDTLARHLLWVEPGRTAIVPGLLSAGRRPDVMRGEEVQLLGAMIGGALPSRALLCQPGTHCKWAWVQDRVIERFTTAMTGELFALLRGHSLLSGQLGSEVTAGAAFLDGVSDAAEDDLLSRLFGVRADAVSGSNRIGDAASYVSGLLIGTDVRRHMPPGQPVHVLAERSLGDLYAAAIDALGGCATLVDSEAAFVSGINGIWSKAA